VLAGVEDGADRAHARHDLVVGVVEVRRDASSATWPPRRAPSRGERMARPWRPASSTSSFVCRMLFSRMRATVTSATVAMPSLPA